MRCKALALVAVMGLACGLLGIGWAADPDSSAADEQILKAAKIGIDNASLLAFFRDRTVSDAARANIDNLIGKLGDNSFKVRQKASVDLVKLGPAAMPFLDKALKNPDLEVSRRAEDVLRQIEEASSIGLPGAAARLLAVRKPPGTVDVLLAYAASGDESAAEDVRNALAANARKDGMAHPDLVQGAPEQEPFRPRRRWGGSGPLREQGALHCGG